ncbi:hypothetical protein NC652_028713 [Populus alba x Populus x berolinensis]|nr:hypothetical protein NC652_028713 [Populus alba x Populus x berolinensis]
MIKRASASPLRYSAEDTGHPSGDCCPNPATHHASGRNVITLSDDSSRSNTTGNGKPKTIPPLPGCCWSYSGCFSAFGHAGILGFLVADYALLWFRIVYVGIYVSKELVPCFCIDLIYLQITLRNGKVIEKPTLEPCEKDDESISEGKEGVESEHYKENIDSPLALPFPHAMTKQREGNHNSEIFETFKQ